MSEIPKGLDEFVQEATPVSAVGAPTQSAVPSDGAPSGLDQFIAPELDAEKYGAPLEQLKAGAEGLAQGLVGPLAPYLEKKLGVNEEDIRKRAEANPATHYGAITAGLVGPALATLGTSAAARAGITGATEALPLISNASKFTQAGLLSKAGETAAGLTGLGGEGAGLLSRAGAGAISGAAENVLFQSGDALSKEITGDPTAASEVSLSNLGLSALIGGGIGGAFGAISPLWTLKSGAKVEQGIQDFKNRVSGEMGDAVADAPFEAIQEAGISRPKANVKEITKAANENGWPLLEGMTSGSKEVQMAEDALLNGPPTLPSIARRKVYQGAHDVVTNSIDEALAAPKPISETQVGSAIQESLGAKLTAENAPFKELYGRVEPYTKQIPLSESIGDDIAGLIHEQSLVEGTPAYDFVKTFSNGIKKVENLDQLKSFRTSLRESSGPQTKRVAGAILDKITELEQNSISAFASSMAEGPEQEAITGLLDQIKQTNKQYAAFKTDLSTLGKNIGKSKIYGPQDFISFVKNMNPQKLVGKVFNEGNTKFAEWFAQKFPEEMQTMAQYQRSLIKEAATKEGVINPAKVLKQVKNMEPEMQRLVFSPEELKVMNDAETYLGSFPKDFNPSHTAHETAFRSFFEHPVGATVANVRDFGIQAFIKAFGHASPGAEESVQTLMPILGQAVKGKEANPVAFKQAVEYLRATIKGETTLSNATKAVFKAGKEVLPAALEPSEKQRNKLDTKLKDLQSNNGPLMDVGGQVGYYLPDHGVALGATAARVTGYLNSIRPNMEKKSPLDSEPVLSMPVKAAYDRALDLAEQPLLAVKSIKSGTLTPQDVAAVKTMYPGLYSKISQKLTGAMLEHTKDGDQIPYKTRMSLSLFLGMSLDSTMTPQAILANQPKQGDPQPQSQQMAQKRPSASAMNGLNKLGERYQTQTQAQGARRPVQS